jgi:predicted TIM-barrel fold metal-dependent hydrolase
MNKIDAHLHVNFNGLNADRLIRYMDEHLIEKCWLLSWEEPDPPVPRLYRHLPVDDILKTCRQYPGRIIPLYAPDPSSNHVRNDLETYMEKGLKGCGELKVAWKWEDSRIDNYLNIVRDLGLPLVFHMEAPRMYYAANRRNPLDRSLGYLWNGAYNGQARYVMKELAKKKSFLSGHLQKKTRSIPGYLYDFEFLEKRLEKYPDLVFIAHGPHFWNHFAAVLSERYFYQKGPVEEFGIIDRLLWQYQNLYCDISGRSGYFALKRDRKKSVRFLTRHAGKILFGTDNLSDGRLERLIHSMGLPREAAEKIFYGNAAKIMGDVSKKPD